MSLSLIDQADEGIIVGTSVTVLYGPPGKGKTTFASQMDKPFFLDLENGSKNLHVKRLMKDKLPTYEVFISVLKDFLKDSRGFKTLVIDSGTALEKLMIKHICGEKYKGLNAMPFGTGGERLAAETDTLMELLRDIQEKQNMDVVLVIHSKEKAKTDPLDNTTWDRYVLRLHDKMADKIISYSDNVFFVKDETLVVQDEGAAKGKAYGKGKTYLYTFGTHAFEAKSRVSLPTKIELDINVYKQALELAKPKSAQDLTEDIKEILSRADADTLRIGTEKLALAGDDIAALTRMKAYLAQMVRPQAS